MVTFPFFNKVDATALMFFFFLYYAKGWGLIAWPLPLGLVVWHHWWQVCPATRVLWLWTTSMSILERERRHHNEFHISNLLTCWANCFVVIIIIVIEILGGRPLIVLVGNEKNPIKPIIFPILIKKAKACFNKNFKQHQFLTRNTVSVRLNP